MCITNNALILWIKDFRKYTYFYILYTLQFWIEYKKRNKEEKSSLNSQIVFSYLFFTLDLIRQFFSSKYFFSTYSFLPLLTWENGRMKEITNTQSKKNGFTIYFSILTKKRWQGEGLSLVNRCLLVAAKCAIHFMKFKDTFWSSSLLSFLSRCIQVTRLVFCWFF